MNYHKTIGYPLLIISYIALAAVIVMIKVGP